MIPRCQGVLFVDAAPNRRAGGRPGLHTRLLVALAEEFTVNPAGLLAEVHGALYRQAALHHRVWIPPETVDELSPAAVRFLAVIEDAMRHLRMEAAASPPTALSAGLGEPLGAVGAGFHMAASSGQDLITLKEAAQLLGFRSAEWVRQLVVKREISGCQEAAWRLRWLVSRSGVITYRERRDGGHGHGGGTRRSA